MKQTLKEACNTECVASRDTLVDKNCSMKHINGFKPVSRWHVVQFFWCPVQIVSWFGHSLVRLTCFWCSVKSFWATLLKSVARCVCVCLCVSVKAFLWTTA